MSKSPPTTEDDLLDDIRDRMVTGIIHAGKNGVRHPPSATVVLTLKAGKALETAVIDAGQARRP
jgi:hypothetical protein